ncbi:MAG: hypothetical protein EU539_00855 [Promethearchaeota archaeon]|nr:MAG: hypothetical protein EU539_00855 [Candidatus Lokiarchaeota archaeon]
MALFNWLVATEVSEVGTSWFDFYSIGHICLGIAIFLFFSLFYTIPKARGSTPIFSLLFVFIITLILLIAWEVLENTLLFMLDLKFENRLDSFQNIFTDIIMGLLGGLIAWLFAYFTFEKHWKLWPYYTFGIICFAVWLGVFIILRELTFLNSPVIS